MRCHRELCVSAHVESAQVCAHRHRELCNCDRQQKQGQMTCSPGVGSGSCESFRVLMCACTVWTFCPSPFYFEFLENISGAQYFVLEHRRNCLIALYPHLVILFVRARTDSRVTSDFTRVFVTQVRDGCFEEPSETT